MQTTHFGRREFRGWPSRKPVWTIAAFVLAAISVPFFFYVEVQLAWTPLQRLYLSHYVRSGIKHYASLFRSGEYHVLEVVNRKGEARTAIEADVVPGLTLSRDIHVPLALSEEARREGWTKLAVSRPAEYEHDKIHAHVGHWIYQDRSLRRLLLPAGILGLLTLFTGLLFALPKDLERARLRKNGRLLRGPERVTPEEFNERSEADGVAFMTEPPRSLAVRLRTLFGGRVRRRAVAIPHALEPSHFGIMGDSGAGKSQAMSQLLAQVRDRGEVAIVYDPALEYTPRFYRPERGDVILNPIDARMPYWNPADELKHDAEAATLAKSLFPDRRGQENRFFIETPRKIMAHLLKLRPSVEELVSWLCQPSEIDRRVQGTELAAMIDPSAPSQRAGVLSSLNLVADALKLLPRADETEDRWTAAEWSRDPQGWIFITSTPETRESLLPLTSFFLDLLVLRLMSAGVMNPGGPRVWFFIDELATLQRLPQFHTAITENRKSGNPVVLGFQGRSQVEARYGDDAEAMLSQPATKLFFRTSEPRAAKWVSETIGEVEIERIRESRTDGRFPTVDRHSKSDMLERTVEDLVMASEIGGLPNLHGYLKVGNLVVPLHLSYVAFAERQPKFIARPTRKTPTALAADDARPAPAAPRAVAMPVTSPPIARSVGRSPAAEQDPFFE